MILKNRIILEIEKALELMGPRPDLPVKIEYARDEKFGDYACTVAMDKRFRDAYLETDGELKNPRKFAEALSAKLEERNAQEKIFEKIEIAGPGFLNLTISAGKLLGIAREATQIGAEYGREKSDNPRKIIFEFVSANPTGPLNVVSARAAALGDSCCNLLEAAGEKVHREFYVNDYGNQVNLLGHSCLLRYFEDQDIAVKIAEKGSDGEPAHKPGPGLPFPAGGYHGDYVIDVMKKMTAEDASLKPGADLEAKARELAEQNDLPEDFVVSEGFGEHAEKMGRAAIDAFLSSQKADLENYRVHFDEFYRESGLHASGAVLKVREALGDTLFKQDGKEFFRSSDYGDDKDRVIVRDDGRPTYLLADIAYHQTKIQRGFDQVWNIWGPDHHGYIPRLAGAMEALGHPKDGFRVLIAQQVNLLDNGKPVKISKRTGNMITMSELLEEIPADVSRYFFVMRSFEAHLDYDLAVARDDSASNPYWYVAMAHARIRSIFGKVGERNPDALKLYEEGALFEDTARFEAALPMTPERRRLLWWTARYPEEVQDAARSLEPHRLITFLYNLATSLAKFYGPRENRIIDQTPETAAAMLKTLEAVAICLKNGLGLLGMNAPDRLERLDEAGLEGTDDAGANSPSDAN